MDAATHASPCNSNSWRVPYRRLPHTVSHCALSRTEICSRTSTLPGRQYVLRPYPDVGRPVCVCVCAYTQGRRRLAGRGPLTVMHAAGFGACRLASWDGAQASRQGKAGRQAGQGYLTGQSTNDGATSWWAGTWGALQHTHTAMMMTLC